VEDVLDLPVALSRGSVVPARAVAAVAYEREPSRLYRKNRRNVVFFTVRTRGVDVRTARDGVMGALDDMERPAGYAFEFDKSAVELQRRYSESGKAFIAAVVFIYIVLAALSESLAAPLAMMSILPAAMLAPIAALRLGWGGIRLSGMASLVVLSGIIVNLSILIVDEARERSCPGKGTASWLYGAVRARAAPIAFMTLTTVAGALPLALVSGSGAEFMKALAVATAWGSVGALASSLTSLPALLALFPRLCDKARRIAGPTST
jgi:HAE1 family hydrophobic/amphiphilic exporter-1